MMGKIIFLLSLITTLSCCGQSSSKPGYFTSALSLSQGPRYQAAQRELDELSIQWKKELEEKFAAVAVLYRLLEAGCPDAAKLKKMEEELTARQNEALALQEQRFGSGGDLFKKRMELAEPLQYASDGRLH